MSPLHLIPQHTHMVGHSWAQILPTYQKCAFQQPSRLALEGGTQLQTFTAGNAAVARLTVLSREKKLLVSSEDYGRDLTGVQNLRKKHKRLEAELAAHEPAIQVRRYCASLCFIQSRGGPASGLG